MAVANVSLTATRDIKVQNQLSLATSNTLTLDAGNTIVIDQSITGVNTPLKLHSDDGVAVNADLSAESIDVRATSSGGLSGSGIIK